MSRPALRLPAMLLALVSLAACTGTPTVQSGPDAETIDNKLYRVDGSAADLVYVDPAVDFSRYHRILLRPLGLDNVEIIQPDSGLPAYARKRDWELTADDRAWLQKTYREAMTREVAGNGGYPLADAAADDVLEITAMLTQLAPNAPRDDNQSRYPGRSQVYTEGAGSISVAVTFADSESGEVLALSKDTHRSTQQWGLNNRVTNTAEARRVFSTWARQIRRGLDRVHGDR